MIAAITRTSIPKLEPLSGLAASTWPPSRSMSSQSPLTPCRLTPRVLSPSAAARGIDLEEGMIERVRAVLVTSGGCLLAIRRDQLGRATYSVLPL